MSTYSPLSSSQLGFSYLGFSYLGTGAAVPDGNGSLVILESPFEYLNKHCPARARTVFSHTLTDPFAADVKSCPKSSISFLNFPVTVLKVQPSLTKRLHSPPRMAISVALSGANIGWSRTSTMSWGTSITYQCISWEEMEASGLCST